MPTRRAKSPRRKPKQARAHDTVEVVLDAAARVLARHGYARATTNRIADAAGVSVGTVYEYFSSKEAVFDALIRRELDALVVAFRGQGLEPGIALDTRIESFLRAGMGAMRHGPELFRAVEAVPGAIFRHHLAGARQLVVGLVEQLLEAHRSELRVADLGLAAFIVVSAVEGVGTNATRQVFDERLARELTSLVMLYLTGSGAEPRPRG
jgi:AcrR family transcriptional regulator